MITTTIEQNGCTIQIQASTLEAHSEAMRKWGQTPQPVNCVQTSINENTRTRRPNLPLPKAFKINGYEKANDDTVLYLFFRNCLSELRNNNPSKFDKLIENQKCFIGKAGQPVKKAVKGNKIEVGGNIINCHYSYNEAMKHLRSIAAMMNLSISFS